MTIHVVTREEYLAGIKAEVQKKGLRAAVEERLNEIVEESSTLSYLGHTFVMEKAEEILDLIDTGRSENE